MKDDEIKCPWCKEINKPHELLSCGATRCYKCKKWFEWQEIVIKSYETYKIIQGG